MSEPQPHMPVFVDSSGRRLPWVRALLWVCAVVAVGYVVLTLSALLGGPRIDAPFLPQPIAAAPAHAEPAPVATTSAPAPSETSSPEATVKAHTQPAPQVVPASAPAPASIAPAPPSAAPSPVPTAPGNSGDTSHGSSSTAPGSGHRTYPTPRPTTAP